MIGQVWEGVRGNIVRVHTGACVLACVRVFMFACVRACVRDAAI